MDCPRCAVEMSELTGDDNTIQRCGDCGGVWTDGTDLNRILLHANLPSMTALGGRVNAEEIAGSCPVCHVDLVVVEGGEKWMMHYDTCESCGGIWVELVDDDDDLPESVDFRAAEKGLVGFFARFRKK
jgi:Zn-finger nucleic acid-binding protein